MNDKNNYYVDTAYVANYLGISENYVRVLTNRGWFNVRAQKQTNKPGRPPALYCLGEIEEAWAERTRQRAAVNEAVLSGA